MVKIRKIRIVLVWIFFLAFLQACSQKKEEIMSIQNPDITANNIVEKLQQEVKHYPKESVYNINYVQHYCFFEVLVNDIPVFKKFNGSPYGGSAFDSNQAIFKSGTQKVTFRMYPVGKVESEDKTYTSFINDTYLNFTVDIYDNTDKNYTTFPIKKYTTPAIPNPVQGAYPDSIFISTGKEYYEGSFTFEAEVPYQLQNFEKAQDLRKMDTKELETKLLKKYNEIKSFYQNRDYDNIARVSYDKLKNELISLYYTKEDAQEMWDNWMEICKHEIKMQPIENYELKFFAEGKLAALITKNQELGFRGNTVLWGKLKENGEENYFKINAYLYIPEGETELKVY